MSECGAGRIWLGHVIATAISMIVAISSREKRRKPALNIVGKRPDVMSIIWTVAATGKLVSFYPECSGH